MIIVGDSDVKMSFGTNMINIDNDRLSMGFQDYYMLIDTTYLKSY